MVREENPTIMHAMTIDVEDYFHVAAFANNISPKDWDNWPCRVEENTDRILQIFADYNVRSTFFVLGWVAERFPQLVQRIVQQGHELASHGYSHQLVYKQSPETFREETLKSKNILEDSSGKKVEGYRAASYSITRESLWALDILSDLGFEWDSSIFPVHHDRYGVPGSPDRPYQIVTKSGKPLLEFPLTSAKIMGQMIPAAGGGYFRQYPYWLSKALFKNASSNNTNPAIFYLHPWEIDPDQPRVEGASLFSRFRHYTNLKACEPRLIKLIQDFNFGTVSDALAGVNADQQLQISDLMVTA